MVAAATESMPIDPSKTDRNRRAAHTCENAASPQSRLGLSPTLTSICADTEYRQRLGRPIRTDGAIEVPKRSAGQDPDLLRGSRPATR